MISAQMQDFYIYETDIYKSARLYLPIASFYAQNPKACRSRDLLISDNSQGVGIPGMLE